MNKPISLMVEETKLNIVNEINKSTLPPFCIKTILIDLLSQVNNLEQKEILYYQENLKKEEQKNDKKNNKNS